MTASPKPPGFDNATTTIERYDILIDCLRHKKYVPFATECLGLLPPEAIGYLIDEVLDSKKSAAHRARIVEIIGIIPGSLTTWQANILVNHRLCKCLTIRNAVFSLFTKLESEGRTLEGNPPGWRCPGGPEELIRLLEVRAPKRHQKR